MIKIKEFIGGYDKNVSYLVWDGDEGVVIDTSVSPSRIFKFAEDNGINIKYAIVMHSHFDHVVELEDYLVRGIKLVGSEKLKEDLDIKAKDGDKIKLKDFELEILYTPGHTLDSICVLIGNDLFTSDTMFVGSYGRTDFGGNLGMLIKSLRRLFELPDETVVHPGHLYGDKPTSTIGEERSGNAINAYF